MIGAVVSLMVNAMAMDHGDSPAPDPEGEMGQYAIDPAVNTRQL